MSTSGKVLCFDVAVRSFLKHDGLKSLKMRLID